MVALIKNILNSLLSLNTTAFLWNVLKNETMGNSNSENIDF